MWFKSTNTNQEMSFKTTNEIILRSATYIYTFYNNTVRKLEAEMSKFWIIGSVWSLNWADRFKLKINRYYPIFGSSYINLPQKILKKQTYINVQNNDDECFN